MSRHQDRKLHRWERSLALILLISLLSTCDSLSAGEPDLPQDVVAALGENAEWLSPITVAWSQAFVPFNGVQETLTALNIDIPASQFFAKSSYRLIWQDGMIYSFWENPLVANDSGAPVPMEASFDGKLLYRGYRYVTNPDLFKEVMAKAIEEEPRSAPFHPEYLTVAGLRIPQALAEWKQPQVMSEILYLLKTTGSLKSVDTVVLDEKHMVRVEVIADNPAKRAADAVDPRKVEEENTQFRTDSPKRRRELEERIKGNRKLPAHRRFVYYLDPTLHYAVQRWEQWYEPDTLLLRCDCTRFEKRPDRQLWLPRTCSIEYYELDTLPGRFFKSPVLLKTYEVSSFAWQKALETQFALDYRVPGTRIHDATLPEAKKTPTGYIGYSVPARPEDLDRAVEEARRRAGNGAWIRSQQRRFVAVTVCSLLLAVCVVVLIWRRRRRWGS